VAPSDWAGSNGGLERMNSNPVLAYGRRIGRDTERVGPNNRTQRPCETRMHTTSRQAHGADAIYHQTKQHPIPIGIIMPPPKSSTHSYQHGTHKRRDLCRPIQTGASFEGLSTLAHFDEAPMMMRMMMLMCFTHRLASHCHDRSLVHATALPAPSITSIHGKQFYPFIP